MNGNWNVQMFLSTLKEAQAKTQRSDNDRKTLRKLYTCIPDNLGKYQIWPMISTRTGLPFEYLYRTREFNIPEIGSDGSTRNRWHKLLPISGYNIIDSSNRLVPGLTQAQMDLLQSAYAIFDQLFEMTPEYNRKDLCRYKNYVVGNAYVLNRYGEKEAVKPVESKFSALLVCTSKNFSEAIAGDISLQMINRNNDSSWLSEVYNRNLTGRTGCLMFTVNKDSNGIGFKISASHAVGLAPDNSNAISEEDAKMMEDPILNFLGWQAGEGSPVGFNEPLINRIIEQMSLTISKIGSPAFSADPNMVANNTNAAAIGQAMPINPTNDPMLANMNQAQVDPNRIVDNNSNPFVNPPAAQFDPLTQVPNPGQQPNVNQQMYQQPAFAQAAAQMMSPQQAQGAPQSYPNNPFDSFQSNPYKQQ